MTSSAPAVAEPTPPAKPVPVESAAAAEPPAAPTSAPHSAAPLPMRADSAPLEIVRHEFTADPRPNTPIAAGVSSESPIPAGAAAPVAGAPLPSAPMPPPAVSSAPLVIDPACERLEEFLAAIERARAAQDTQSTR
jgi:hypothetical protein